MVKLAASKRPRPKNVSLGGGGRAVKVAKRSDNTTDNRNTKVDSNDREKKQKLHNSKNKKNEDSEKAKVDREDSEEESDGVAIDELDSDDFLFGSGASDDELSSMPDSESDMAHNDQGSLGSDEDSTDIDSDEEDEDEDEEGSVDGIERQEEDDNENSDSDKEWQKENEEALEMAYEDYLQKRSRRTKLEQNELYGRTGGRLPIRLANGTVVRLGEDGEEEDMGVQSRSVFHGLEGVDDDEEAEYEPIQKISTTPGGNTFGKRFGRPAMRDILTIKNRKQRFEATKNEIAQLGREIIADPEGNINNLKRLLGLCQKRYSEGKTQEKGKGSSSNKKGGNKKKNQQSASSFEVDERIDVVLDTPIRIMAIISLLAVFLDIIPGYRIRPLTEIEKTTKMSQMVQKQHDFEQGLVGIYRQYLEICEQGLKKQASNSNNEANTMRNVCAKCLCEILKEKSHFNFSINIMESVVKIFAWHNPREPPTESFENCLSAITIVFDKDNSGENSLHLVRHIIKAIKTKSAKIHPAIMTVLLRLRLDEQMDNVRASTERAEYGNASSKTTNGKERKESNNKKKSKNGHLGAAQSSFMNKKTRKAMKDREAVEKELEDAEAGVRSEKKRANRTETLKLLFGLYFRILKMPHRSPLLSGALEGLGRFSKLINVDFFVDLLGVLKSICAGTHFVSIDNGDEGDEEHSEERRHALSSRERLLCIVTAFDLLAGQGHALDIDLSGFISQLYNILPVLALSTRIDERNEEKTSEADLVFRALNFVFFVGRTPVPGARVHAFAKRLLICAMHWSDNKKSGQRAIEFVKKLLVRNPRLEAQLGTSSSGEGGQVDDDKEDRIAGEGVYNAFTEDESLANAQASLWWELGVLELEHYDGGMRDCALRLLHYEKTVNGRRH